MYAVDGQRPMYLAFYQANTYCGFWWSVTIATYAKRANISDKEPKGIKPRHNTRTQPQQVYARVVEMSTRASSCDSER